MTTKQSLLLILALLFTTWAVIDFITYDIACLTVDCGPAVIVQLD